MLNKKLSRRNLLGGSVGAYAALGIDAALPSSLARAAALSMEGAADSAGGRGDKRIVVVVQLSGGNDGLNTVVPFTDKEYYSSRPKLAIPKGDVLGLTDEAGLHPAMKELANCYESGQFAVVQGVGYESPNRSHFESMDIWHTCSAAKDRRTGGWIGQAAETLESSGGDPFAMHLGAQKQPLALASNSRAFPSLASVDEFQLRGQARENLQKLLREPVAEPASDDLLGFIQSNTSSAVVSSERIGGAIDMKGMSPQTPKSDLGQKLSVVGQLIAAGLDTQIYYVQLDGFDTHARQADSHRSLLQTWSEATAALQRQLEASGDADRVCLFTFSEFGRRVRENASEGTDHGAAAPAFMLGNRVRGGVLGESPNLQDLDDGDVRYSVDFRRLYATLLREWLEIEPRPVLGGDYESLDLFDI